MFCCAITAISALIGFLLTILVVGGIWYRKKAVMCHCTKDMIGKTVIITGANAGIGKETAKSLAKRSAKVIMACRNMSKAQKVRDEIVDETGNGRVLVRQLDLADLESVRKFANRILEEEDKLDVLINNAGLIKGTRAVTKEGYEETFVANHLGHFLLTNILLDLLIKSGHSRIVNVSSGSHKSYHLDLDDLHFKRRPYKALSVYSQSKLCNVLFTKELAHKIAGQDVTVTALHPGVVSTNFASGNGILGQILWCFMRIIGKTCEQGAQTTIHLAISEEGGKLSGQYFSNCKAIESSKKSQDSGLAKKLWEISEQLVDLKNEEKHF